MRHVNVAIFIPHLGCPHRCSFCDQNAISGQGAVPSPAEIAAVCAAAAKDPHDPKNSEIAFFGGSFTAVDRETMLACLDAAAPFLKTDFGGIRVSTRPDAVDAEVLSLLKEKGVTAVELGAQSMNAAVLARCRRGHTPADTVKAAALIKAYGFSLGLQMMTGLPGSTPETDLETARALLALSPDTVRIYPTLVLEGTALAAQYRAGSYSPPSLDESAALCAALLELFEGAGVRVIKLGLHAGENVARKLVAGPYHPAFRELCEGRIYRRRIEEALISLPGKTVLVRVCPGHASKAAGHGGENRAYFAAAGYRLKITEEEGLPAFCPQISAAAPGKDKK